MPGLPVVIPGIWKSQMTRTAGAFASDTVLGTDLTLDSPGLWFIEWYAFMRTSAAGGISSFTFLVRQGLTERYAYALAVPTGAPQGGTSGPAHRILYVADGNDHVVQIETNTGILLGDSAEVRKSAMMVNYVTQIKELRTARVLSLEGLDIVKTN